MGIVDWGLGIAQSPIPNPQSPIINWSNVFHLINSIYYYIKYNDDKTYNIEY